MVAQEKGSLEIPFSANLRKRCPNLSLPKPALKSLSPMAKGLIGVGMVLTSTGRLQGIGRILPEGTKSSVLGFSGSGDFLVLLRWPLKRSTIPISQQS